MEFKTHAEKEFWEKIFIDICRAGGNATIAKINADMALEARRERMVGLIKPGVKAA